MLITMKDVMTANCQIQHAEMLTSNHCAALARELTAMFSAPVPPAGGSLKCWSCKADFTLSERANCDGCCWKCGNEIDLDDYVTRLTAEVSALQQRLTIADQRVDDLEKDKQRLDALETNFWDVRHHSAALADTGDYTGGVEIVGRWMDKPHERVIGEDYNESLRAAIDQAMTADAYPPARPEYPEFDAALSEENWQMNPCKQGHRDVGACQGTAFCHICDETITAPTTEEAFAQWNATHQASPQ